MFVQRRMAIHSTISRMMFTLAAAGAAVGLMSACAHVPGVYTYVPAGQKGSGSGAVKKFDAKTYANDIWASKVVPTVKKDSVQATELLPALEADQAAASKKYGNQAGTGSPYAFLVRGSGLVTKVDADAPTHPITITVDGLKGRTGTVQLVTGPVIVGTALRDGVKFIKFGDFTNQLEYADVATELNNRAKSDVLAKIQATALVGKKVNFAGAFSLVAPGVVLIVPTELAVAS